MKTYKIIYWISTGIFTLLILFSAGIYFFQTTHIKEEFTSLGYPTYLIIPLGIVKLMGLISIWFIPNKSLKEWTYAGFFFNIILASFAHIMVSDGEFPGALIGMVLLLTSYFSRKKVYN